VKVLVDTNVILDVVLKRPGVYVDSFAIFTCSEDQRINGCVSASAMTDIFYVVYKDRKDLKTVYDMTDELIYVFSIVPVFETTIMGALALRWKDFEDAVQYLTAQEQKAEYIITRNKDDYKTSAIPCMTPTEFIMFLQEMDGKAKNGLSV
jgi:predicted nucleic acid-binding protein